MREVRKTSPHKRLHQNQRITNMLPLPGQSSGKLHRLPQEPPQQASTPPKVNFWEERARKKKEMTDAAKAKNNPPDQPKHPPPAHTEETSSSLQPKDQHSPQKASPQTREPSSSTREMSSSLPNDSGTPATPQDPPTLMDTISQINDPEVQEMIDVVQKFLVPWNADGIRTRIPEFEEYIQRYDPDIIALQENFHHPCHSFNIPNYTIYRNDRLTHSGGGIAILIKNSIAHRSINIHTHSIENTTIVIEGTNKKDHLQLHLQTPPNSPHQALIPDLLKIFRNRSHCFIGGDFNAKHHSWSPHSRDNACGSTLFKFLKNCGFLLSSSAEPATIDCGLDDVLVETQV
ncbi:hypothetical protein TNCV_4250291 [Trichonephila clavipes]|nr:hypothetical protein TNCV_4250291 [Trichonephila clavipes]